MNVLSLFSGIGGLDLGLERAGMTVVGQVEIDPWCRRVLAKHWPEVPRHDDVRTCADWWGRRPAPDVVAGGFPCQPVSSAGRRLAQDDPRWLWPAMADTIRRLRPRYALMENVPGLLARGMGDVLGDLAACGYDAEWDCVPASAVGAPHRRDRVWIVAYPQSHLRRAPGDDRPIASHGRHSLLADAQRDTRDERRPGDSSEGTRRRHSDRGAVSAHVADADGGRLEVSAQLDSPPPQDPANGHPCGGHSDGLRHKVAHANGSAWASARPAGQTVFRPGEIERPGRCGSGDGGFWAVEPAVGRVAHGIPQRVDRLRGLGNAVVPQVAEHIGRLIMGAAA